jgi:Zn-dependent protease with chaperone function
LVISPVENFILFSTIFGLVCFSVSFVTKIVAERRLCNPSPQTLIRLYTRALVVPPILAAWIVAAAFLPEWWLPDAFNAAHSRPHDLHLLADVTAKLEPTLAYMMLLFAVSAALFAAWSGWRGYFRVGRLISQLEMNAEPAEPHQLALVNETARRYGLEVGLVMSNYPFSFVWGFRRSKLILSTGLLHTLNREELRGLLEHEAAHHERLDNMIKLALSFCTYASLAVPFTSQLLRWRS